MSLTVLPAQAEIEGGMTGGRSEFQKKQAHVIARDQTVLGDRYFLGKTVQVAGLLDGDLYSASESVKVQGTVTGDFNALAQSIDVTGEVGDDLRICGKTLQVSGRIGGDLLFVGGELDIMEGASVGGRTLAGGGEITLSGNFEQDVHAGGGQVVFGGQAKRNVEIEADVLRFEPGAHIKGDLTYTARQEIESLHGEEARKIVEGVVTFVPKETGKKDGSKGGVHWLWETWTFISALIVGCLLITIAGRPARTIVDTARKEALKSLGFGVLGHIFVPFAGLVLMVLCLTLPAGVLILVAWGVLFYVAKLVVSASLADAILRRLGRSPSLYLALFLGMIPVWILFMVPVLGSFLYYFIVPIFGIGAILVGSRAHARKSTGIVLEPSGPQPEPAAL